LDLQSLLERRPKELSGGQRQRVALGRAIVRKPEVYLFDEPLSNLDAKLRLKMRVELGSLQKDLGVTSIYVTHDQVEAMTLGKRIVIMNNGVLQQVGTPKEIYEKPENLFVAGFIGSPPMNFLDCKIKNVKDSYIIDLEGNNYPLHNNNELKKYENKKIIAGIRPNDFSINKNEHYDNSEFISGVVNVVEYLGNSNLLYISTNNNSICVEQDSNLLVEEGDEVILYTEQKNIHLFDPSNNGSSVLKSY